MLNAVIISIAVVLASYLAFSKRRFETSRYLGDEHPAEQRIEGLNF